MIAALGEPDVPMTTRATPGETAKVIANTKGPALAMAPFTLELNSNAVLLRLSGNQFSALQSLLTLPLCLFYTLVDRQSGIDRLRGFETAEPHRSCGLHETNTGRNQ